MQDRGAESVNILMQEIALSISFNSQLHEHSFNKAFMKNGRLRSGLLQLLATPGVPQPLSLQ